MNRKIAVLFDLDGTLVDTEPYWFKSIKKIAEENGYQWTQNDSAETVGANLATTVQVLCDKAGISCSLVEVRTRLITGMNKCYQDEGVPWLEGAYELLLELGAAGIPTAVVSNSPRILVEQVVKLAPTGSITLVVPGDTPNLKGKPAADPYLYASEKLGVEIKNCCIYEDSLTGITAAVRSGGKVVLLGDTMQIENLDSDVKQILSNPQKSCFSPGLWEWNLPKIRDFLS